MSTRRPAAGAKQAWPLPTLLLLLASLLLLSACGRKGPIRPLLKPLPAAPGDFTILQKGDHLLLGWNIPQKNQDGSALTDLQGFRVYRLKYEPGRDCPECSEVSELFRLVDLDYLREARRVGNRLYLRDENVEPGFGFRYRIAPFTRSGFEGISSTAQRIFKVPPPTPGSLAASALDHLVRLRWNAVGPPPAGEKLLGYNVYRRTSGEIFPVAPVNPAVLTKSAFEDFGVENGKTYFYAIRTVVSSGGLRVESSLSEPVEAKPQPGK